MSNTKQERSWEDTTEEATAVQKTNKQKKNTDPAFIKTGKKIKSAKQNSFIN